MKVNLGSGPAYLPGWVNVDASPDAKADVHSDPLDFVRHYGDQVEEIYIGNALEHGVPESTLPLLRLLRDRLPGGAQITAATPNLDQSSLSELFSQAGFGDVELIDPQAWMPIDSEVGYSAVSVRVPGPAPAPIVEGDLMSETDEPGETSTEVLLRRMQMLRGALSRQTREHEELLEEVRALRERLGEPEVGPAEEDEESHFLPVPPAPKVKAPPAQRIDPAAPAPSLKGRVRQKVKTVLPPGSKQHDLARAALLTYRSGVDFARTAKQHFASTSAPAKTVTPEYGEWLHSRQVTGKQLAAQRGYAEALADPARIQIVVVPGEGPVARTVQSLTVQSWPHWAADVLVGGISGGARDERVTLRSGTVDAAVAAGTADFVIVLRAGDVLSPDCLYSVAITARQDPLIQLVSWDDDVINDDEARHSPRFRPNRWSPELLLSAGYLGRSFAIRRERFLSAGGFGSPAQGDDTPWWSLVLSSDLVDEQAGHVARVLSSVTTRPDSGTEAGAAAVREHLQRRGLSATVEAAGERVRVRWEPRAVPRVSIVIPTLHYQRWLSRLLPSLQRTDYPDFEVLVVQTGARTAELERWYEQARGSLDLRVLYSDEKPFNYSRVNNTGARETDGDVLVFLNDDTEVTDSGWLRELVGWAVQDEIGVVGAQLLGTHGEIQHGGIALGINGFADHLFQDMQPGSDTLFGPTNWTRDVLAVTGACLAVRRELFDAVGGFDEQFVLCGSDVVLGLDMILRGKRNVVTADTTIRHFESSTRGSDIPRMDFFSSFWRYNSWLFGGDPYFSPNLSLESRIPTLRSIAEPSVGRRIGPILGHDFEPFRQTNDAENMRFLVDHLQALPVDTEAVNALHKENSAPFAVQSINWFIPGVDSPFYGGINTMLRIADQLAREHGVLNRFVTFGEPNEEFLRSALAAAFPALADSEIAFYQFDSRASLDNIPYADVSVATLWVTAYAVAHFAHTRRKFYLIQDFEPGFYPAGTEYALAEESYKLGLYGLCNTENLRRVYTNEYGGKGFSFVPAVDQNVFHARWRHERGPDAPVTVFLYARPGHWRNCWEMAAPALEELKRRLGDKVRIVAAGAWAIGAGAEVDIKRLGLLDYSATGELYRHTDIGMALTVSRHPSYLPLELMACGAPVVAFDNPWGHWLLKDGENCLLSKRTADSLADRLEKLATDPELRQRLSEQGLRDIAARHSDWQKNLSGIYGYLCDPEGAGTGTDAVASFSTTNPVT
ncbi:MAG TPA: glycosyltransferase [Mycobacteriales bacterium]|nr:glycosyltransferase [Mycobacteriales bacterium]